MKQNRIGIFGIGLNRGLSDEYRTIVDLINEKEGIKLALDIPSGLSAEISEKLKDEIHKASGVSE